MRRSAAEVVFGCASVLLSYPDASFAVLSASPILEIQ